MWDIARDTLTVLIIPLVIWGVSLEVRSAVAAERLSTVTAEMSKIDGLALDVKDNALKLVRLEGKLDTANSHLKVLRRMLSSRSEQAR